jgi:hypothetical protein
MVLHIGEHRRALLFLQSVNVLYNSIQQQRTLFTSSRDTSNGNGAISSGVTTSASMPASGSAVSTPTTSSSSSGSSGASTSTNGSNNSNNGNSNAIGNDDSPPELSLPVVTSLCTSLPHLVHTSDILWNQFDNRYTLTLYYLAQVHGHLKNASLSAQYCHQTLQRQLVSKLEFNPRVCHMTTTV